MTSWLSPEKMPELQYPEWQLAYVEALAETNPEKLRQLIANAEEVIHRRQTLIADGNSHQPELDAIRDSLTFLRALRRDVLGKRAT